MTLHFMSYRRATLFLPSRQTYMIRIYDDWDDTLNGPQNQLQESDLFTTAEYSFSDIDPDTIFKNYPELDQEQKLKEWTEKDGLFTREQARDLVADFKTRGKDCLDVVVHCTLGAARSPAVALALNDLFDLGGDSEKIRSERAHYVKYVYRLLMEEGQKILGQTI